MHLCSLAGTLFSAGEHTLYQRLQYNEKFAWVRPSTFTFQLTTLSHTRHLQTMDHPSYSPHLEVRLHSVQPQGYGYNQREMK